MSEKFGEPEFWFALVVGLGTLALFFYWLRTGGRKPH